MRIVERVKTFAGGVRNFIAKVGNGPWDSGGWSILAGILNSMFQWTGAGEIFRRLSPAEEERSYVQELVFIMVKTIATSMQEAPLKVGFQTKQGWTDVANHRVEALLKAPNPAMHGSEYIWHVCAHLQLTGYSYVWKWRNGLGVVTELWPVPSSWVTPICGGDGRIAYYTIFQGRDKEPLPVPLSNMFRTIFPNPADLSTALGPLQAATRSIQTDDERSSYAVEMLRNNKQPGMVLKQPDGWSEEEKRDAERTIKAKLDKGNRGKPFFLSGEKASLDMIDGMKDLDMPGLSNLTEGRVCAIFSVPAIVANLRSGLENGSFANYGQACKAYWRQTVKPQLAFIANAHTKGLLRDEGESDTRLEVYADTSNVNELQEDQDNMAKRAENLFASGLADKNECRALVGLPPLPAAQNGFMQAMGSELVTGALSAPVEAPPKDDGKDAGEGL